MGKYFGRGKQIRFGDEWDSYLVGTCDSEFDTSEPTLLLNTSIQLNAQRRYTQSAKMIAKAETFYVKA